MIEEHDLLKKYDVPVPRYTSYPVVPAWETENFSAGEWRSAVTRCFNETNEQKGISLYIHLPFCESLCTYCACNTRITKNHQVETRYIAALLDEWQAYLNIFGRKPILRELHLGGGTPTFFTAQNLHHLLSSILNKCIIHPEAEFSFEGHPNNTTREHLETLFDLGFRRVSFGVQDLDLKVQQTINRVQPFENLKSVTMLSREIGYTSVSFDLVYGLPYQTTETVSHTIEKVLNLRPDRISFYSYAHVPWIKPGQRGYEDSDLPSDVVKRQLYETGRELLRRFGYRDVGMDHFALPHDALWKASASGKLHRNFMGYTVTHTELLLGLGASSISDAKYAYAQNVKKVEDYETRVHESGWAIEKGHVQTEEDLVLKSAILDIACRGSLNLLPIKHLLSANIFDQLCTMAAEGIIELEQGKLLLTAAGRPFIRNVCRVFDLRLGVHRAAKAAFSKAI